MRRERLRVIWFGVVLAFAACQKPALRGVAQKGPFLLGSSVKLELLTAAGASQGTVFRTQTADGVGAFSLELDRSGPVSITVTGSYFDELSGRTGTTPALLTSLVEADGKTQANVNIVTHLSNARARRLMRDGKSATAAEQQAEGELRAAMGTASVPNVPARTLDLLGGDTDANAWLFAVSVVVPFAAQSRQRDLGEYLATIANDLADDGTLEAGLVDDLRASRAAFNPVQNSLMEANLTRYLSERGITAEVPRLDRVMDPDGDGHPSISDDCPVVANEDQRDADGDGIGDACDCGNGTVDPGEECDDGNVLDGDGCEAACTLPRCGNGVVDPDELCFEVRDSGLVFTSFGEFAVAALDGDRCDDLLVSVAGGVAVLTSDCAGRFRQSASFGLADGGSASVQTADMNLDGITDLLAVTDGQVYVVLGSADGGFGAPISTLASWLPGPFTVGAFDSDLLPDLVVSNSTATDLRVTIVHGDGLGSFSALGATTTLGAVSMNSTTASIGALRRADFDRATPSSDLVVSLSYVQPGVSSGAVSVFRPQTDGGFESIGSAPSCQGFALADFDRDGEEDLLSSDCRNASFLARGAGPGSLITVPSSPLLSPAGPFLMGDFNRDGRPDVAMGRYFAIFRDGGFDVKRAVVGGQTFGECQGCPHFVATGDFNGDGRADVMVEDGTALLSAD